LRGAPGEPWHGTRAPGRDRHDAVVPARCLPGRRRTIAPGRVSPPALVCSDGRGHEPPWRDEEAVVSGGLAALFDDIAALAKMAAASVDDVGAAAGKASAKAAGVVVDDTAVTPRYLHGFTADRELPMVRRIAVGSIRNKLLIILPVILLLSQFLPWLLTPILMLGGTYLCYEGAEKIWEKIAHHEHHEPPAAMVGANQEDSMVRGAIRTDLILSAEIMVIALNEVADEPLLSRALILVVVAVVITAVVYGVVALIVKMDDVGLRLAERPSRNSQRVGRALVRAMPSVLAALSTIGVVAMLWVGGHIILGGLDELGWSWLYDQVHHLEEVVREATGALGGVLAWSVNTVASALLGLVVGAVVVVVMSLVRRVRSRGAAARAA
jgi:predicted DNA repair protein MutK